MKKIFQSYKHKAMSRKKSLRELTRRKKNIFPRNGRVKNNGSKRGVHLHEMVICAPLDCSLVINSDETIRFFAKIDSLIMNQKLWIKIDFSETNYIGNEVLLYLLSRMDAYRTRFGYAPLKGNFPKNEIAKKTFTESGFYKFVHTDMPVSNISNIETLTIRNGQRVQPEIAGEIVAFIRHHIPTIDSLILRNVYRTVIECMANTNNHAYSDNSEYFKWWLICKADPINSVVMFNFIDNGVGIPSTVKRKFLEKINFTKDWEFVDAALSGEWLRSRTGKIERGKGLPSLLKQYKTGVFKDLNIISRNAFVDIGNSAKNDLPQKFFGTLINWRI